MLTDHPELFDGMRLVPCAVMTDNDSPQAGWLFIPHADGKWVSAAKLQPFSQQIINYWWNRPSSAEVRAEAKPVAPTEAIGKILSEVMKIAVANGANSISMPDEYVEVAAWLSGIAPQPPAPCKTAPSFGVILRERNALQAKVDEQSAEIERLKASLPTPAHLSGCNTLQDWRFAAMYFENQWKECSNNFQSVAGKNNKTIAQQSALIEQCRGVLRTCVKYADQFFDADSVASAIAAIAAYKK